MTFSFNEQQRKTLFAIGSTVNPRLIPQTGDSKVVFEHELNGDLFVQQIERQFENLSEGRKKQVVNLVDKLGKAIRSIRWTRRFQSFPGLNLEQRVATLNRVLRQGSPSARAVLNSLIRTAAYLSYSEPATSGNDVANPTWRAIGYVQSENAVSPENGLISARIHVTQNTFACDYLVIGSGAGGSVVAAELAETGRSIVLVEQGELPGAGLDVNNELTIDRRRFDKSGSWGSTELSLPILSGDAIDGCTLVNSANCFDPPARVLRRWATRFGFVDCLTPAFRHSLFTVRRRLNVTECKEHNEQNKLLLTGCQQLGWKTQIAERMGNGFFARTGKFTESSDGTRSDARQAYLLDALRLGVQLVPRCTITKLVVLEGRVERALGLLVDEFGSKRNVEFVFRNVVLAAGAINSPAILLRSGVRNAHLGQHLQLHPSAIVLGLYERPVLGWQGTQHSIICNEFAGPDPEGLGFRLETASIRLGVLATAVPWRSPAEHKRIIQAASRMAAVVALLHDDLERTGTVTINRSERAEAAYRIDDQIRTGMIRAIIGGLRVHRAARAEKIFSPIGSVPDFHNANNDQSFEKFLCDLERRWRDGFALSLFRTYHSSTCRLADSPSSGVVDTVGRVFGLSNCFVCDASMLPSSPGVNPMVTIATTAHFLSQKIKQLTARSSN